MADPTVTACSPNVGPAAGGTSVTLTGTNFTGTTASAFDYLASYIFSCGYIHRVFCPAAGNSMRRSTIAAQNTLFP